jgi:uroporphyrinogen-III decarboxylase
MTEKENLLRAILHTGPEWVPRGMESVVMIGPPVIERPDNAGTDAFGAEWSEEDIRVNGTYPTPGGNPVTDLADWRRQLQVPDVKALDWSAAIQKTGDVDREEHVVCGFVEMGLFERSYLLLGMSDALIAYSLNPEEMYELIGAVADYKIRLIEAFDDAVGLDMVWYGDDWGTQQDLFMSPEVWRRIIKPHTGRIYDCMKQRNIVINQHSCGKIERVFADVVEIGADMWNPCQPCNNLAALKRQFAGKIAFCGGIDSQFVLDRPDVTPEEVREEVRRRIDEMAAGGGYVATPSHSVPYRPEIVTAMEDEIATYGRAYYAN